MLTVLLIFLPVLGGILTWLMKGETRAKQTALSFAVLNFLVSAWALFRYVPGDNAVGYFNYPWIDKELININFHVALDGISILLVLLTTFLVPLIILSSFGHSYKKSSLFYSLILFMQSALIGVFVARDAFLFYIFWELALIPIYFIALIWGGAERLKVTIKFFIYTLFGSLFMLVAIIYLYIKTGPEFYTFDMYEFYNLHATNRLSSSEQLWVFWGFFLAFAIKMPIFPFHTWQPDTYTVSPSPGTMLLSGIMLKMGIFGVIRWMIPVVPYAFLETWGGYAALILSIIGIIYASVIALRQKDLKRLIAYVSIAHVGLMAAGVFIFNFQGIQGAVIQMLAHGINVVGLFYIIDIIQERTKTREIEQLGGIRNVAPVFNLYFLIILLSSVALPLTGGFIGEFLLFVGIFQFNHWLAAIAGLTIIFGAVYMLTAFRKVMLGETNSVTATFTDLKTRELAVLIPIALVIFWIGVYPKMFLDISAPAVTEIINSIKTVSLNY